MTTFVVHSDLPCDISGATKWVSEVPKMLAEHRVSDVRLTTAYCCIPDKKIVAEFEGPDKEAVRRALSGIGMSITDISESIKLWPPPELFSG